MTDTLQHISPIWTRARQFVAERGEGTYLYDAEGTQYLDFTSGIGVTNTGHAHPKVVTAIQEQAALLIHGQANIVFHPPMLQLVEELLTVVPPGLDSFFLSNSGAEIVEAAVKLSKQATKRTNAIVFSGSFHGRTHLTMAMTTSKTVYRLGYQPLVPGIFVAPYPYAYKLRMDEETTTDYCLDELKRLLKNQTAPEETACVVIEPVLGEGGYVQASPRFLQELRELCSHYGILMVADEVQSGFGRTGKWFGIQHAAVTPDIMIMAKGIASGMPLSALAASRRLMDKWIPGTHGGTYGGNAVACAAAAATIHVIREEDLVENAARMGEVLTSGLRQLQEGHPEIGDVRGPGLMVGVEFTDSDGNAWTDRAKDAVKTAFEQERLMLLSCGTYDNTIRWIPPLIADEAQIKDGLDRFERVLDTIG
jgi:4-aminobutyrate aminotransferase